MTQIDIVTKWRFIVEFEDQETGEISGTIGQADTLEECEGLVEYDKQYHREHGRTVVNVETFEAICEGISLGWREDQDDMGCTTRRSPERKVA